MAKRSGRHRGVAACPHGVAVSRSVTHILSMRVLTLCWLACLVGMPCGAQNPLRTPLVQTPTAVATNDSIVEQLLHLHHQQRVAHVLGDPQALVASFATDFTEVSSGQIRAPTHQQVLSRFSAYLSAVRFLEWENVAPPRIRVAPSGKWAEVIVRKRVRAIASDTVTSRSETAATFAWTERWTWTPNGWRLSSLTSTRAETAEQPRAALADVVRAHEILARARRVLGGDSVVAAVATLRFDAECEGPNGHFTTEVASARDGRVRFAQRHSPDRRFAAGVSLDGPWQGSASAATPTITDSARSIMGTVIDAHELHLLAIAPEARYTNPVAQGRERIDGSVAAVVRFLDRRGAPADFFYDVNSGLPIGFRVVNHTGRGASPILTTFHDWLRVGSVRLPHRVVIAQGSETYTYHMTSASTDWLPDAAFSPVP